MYVVTLVPRRVRHALDFEARDPWNGDAPASFSLDAYKMIPQHMHKPSFLQTLGQPELFGLCSSLDPRERLLPAFLSGLWQTGRLRPEALPALLHAAEGSLVKRDYFPIPWVGFVVATVLGLFCAVPAALARFALPDTRNALGGVLLLVMLFGGTLGVTGLLALPVLAWRRRRASRFVAWALEQAGAAS